MSTQLLLPHTFIQTEKLYKLIKMDFISLFKKCVYRNTYIYNLIDDFSTKYIYYGPTFGVGTNNIIILFDHYL